MGIRKEYGKRNQILKRVGFKNYQDYLASDLWAKIRARQLRKHVSCFICRDPATQVHHGKYTLLNLLGHSERDLFSVCCDCHRRIEFEITGEKRTVSRASKAMWIYRKSS